MNDTRTLIILLALIALLVITALLVDGKDYARHKELESLITKNHKELMNYITDGKTVVSTTDVTEGAEYSISVKRTVQ